jgi:hypothetical protein
MTQINGRFPPRCHHLQRTPIPAEAKLMPKPAPQTDPRVDEAMNTVLEKERQSREKIEHCEREAATLLDKARRRARAVADRTDKRITAFRQRCEETTRREVDELLAGDSERSERTPMQEREISQIDAAVRRLAARLTGDGADDDDKPATP